ncbi:MFS general substrate transporter [Mytilinidion resinicola]|uniref:MFS general substrate transporter n=1 Tax=Mytilinidion resinicola TaxID=574789 RepID=A0A6A6Y7B6_9PEZI|nr:MFS general substrate transporter [Mytilinidion resinicola]KAF2804731.1 MFS general substrate transporter [Mytilinidion resinicola]
MAIPKRSSKWYRIKWFTDEDTAEERKLILKLDLLIVPYAFLSYWVKYIDQANINNAYVGGLKEDLNFQNNQLVHLQTLYTLGAVLGQLPFLFLFPKIPMYLLIPSLDVVWGVFTLLQYRANSYAELAAYRFLVGWFEAAFFPAMHFIFGSWYRGDEIARRGGVFYVGLTLGTMTAGFIQAGASAKLDGLHGLAGWRWMYIICAIITIPIGLLGLVVLPGTPDKPNRLILTKKDIELASFRLERAGHVLTGKVTWGTVVKLAKSPRIWALLLLDVFFWNGSVNTSTGGYLLWLKSLKRYSKSRLNELGTASPGLGIFYTLLVCFSSDLLLGPAWAITLAHTWNIIGLVILTIWDVPEPAKWFAFMTTYSAVAMSSVLYGWINSQLKYSPAERSFTLLLANALAQSTTAWTPLLTFKTMEAPRFKKGYPFVLANAVCLIALAHIISWYIERKE